MLQTLPKKPEVISTDKGNEFTGAVQSMLDAKGIIRRTKDPLDVNALSVVDRAIQNLKKRLAESLSAEEGEWASRIKEVVKQYNATPHETVHGEPARILYCTKLLADLINCQIWCAVWCAHLVRGLDWCAKLVRRWQLTWYNTVCFSTSSW